MNTKIRMVLTYVTRILFVLLLVSLSLFCVYKTDSAIKIFEKEQLERARRQTEIMSSAINGLVEDFAVYNQDEIYIPSCSPLYYEIRTGNVEFSYNNPKDNACYLRISITRKDTSETIYSSSLISPGSYIDEISFAPRFSRPGYYDCMIKVDTFSADKFSFLGSIVMETYVCAY